MTTDQNQQAQGQSLTTTSLKDLAQPFLTSIEFDGIEGVFRIGELPPITQELKENARVVLLRLEKHLAPAGKDEILQSIYILLQHYYVNELPEAVHKGLAEQWYSVLKPYPFWAVQDAVTGYLSDDTKGRKPVPGQIRELCAKATNKYHSVMHQCRKVLGSKIDVMELELSEEEKEASRQRVSELVAQAKQHLSSPESAFKTGSDT